jgi:hypothetical protein
MVSLALPVTSAANVQMLANLSNKRILLGISGGIAAYKSADLVRRLQVMQAPRCAW